MKNLNNSYSFSHVSDLIMELFHAFLFVSVWELVESVFSIFLLNTINVVIEMITSDSSSELHVLLQDGGSLGVDGTKVGVLEDSDEVCL